MLTNWNNLKKYLCPGCDSPLADEGDSHKCTRCKFTVLKRKFDRIVSERYAKPVPTPDQVEDNLGKLNNWDGEENGETEEEEYDEFEGEEY